MPKDVDPIDADFDEVARKMVTPAPPLSNKGKGLAAVSTPAPAPHQLPLDLGIEVERTIGGVEMGVLQNGISYLTQIGLAEVSGAARSTVFEVTQEWEAAMKSGTVSPRSRVAMTPNACPALCVHSKSDSMTANGLAMKPALKGCAVLRWYSLEVPDT